MQKYSAQVMGITRTLKDVGIYLGYLGYDETPSIRLIAGFGLPNFDQIVFTRLNDAASRLVEDLMEHPEQVNDGHPYGASGDAAAILFAELYAGLQNPTGFYRNNMYSMSDNSEARGDRVLLDAIIARELSKKICQEAVKLIEQQQGKGAEAQGPDFL